MFGPKDLQKRKKTNMHSHMYIAYGFYFYHYTNTFLTSAFIIIQIEPGHFV